MKKIVNHIVDFYDSLRKKIKSHHLVKSISKNKLVIKSINCINIILSSRLTQVVQIFLILYLFSADDSHYHYQFSRFAGTSHSHYQYAEDGHSHDYADEYHDHSHYQIQISMLEMEISDLESKLSSHEIWDH